MIICASDAVTYAVNSNVKVVQLCHVHIVYFWNYVAVIFPYFCKFAIALLIRLLPIFTRVQLDSWSPRCVAVDGIW